MVTRIDHGKVWTSGSLRSCSVLIRDGRIAALADPDAAQAFPCDTHIDASGQWILPGGVDLHVHISDGAETFADGSSCAAAGGITTVLDMAPFHACVTPEQMTHKIAQAEAACVVDFGLVSGIVVCEEDLAHLAELAAMGAPYFKVFMPGNPAVTPQVLWAAVQTAARTGLRLGLHAEEPGCLERTTDWQSPTGFAASRPAAAESAAVAQVLEMARAAGAPVHICHVSAAATAGLVCDAKAKGVDVTAEVPPHFLLFDESEFERQGARVMTTPPLRREEDTAALWQALADGVIDALASDHFLGTRDPLAKDFRVMKDAAAGIAGLELSLPLLFSEGVQSGRLSLQRFVEAVSTRPAQIAHLDDRKGHISPGADADLVLMDPAGHWEVDSLGGFSRCGSSPYYGWKLQGHITRTMVRGSSVWDGTEISAAAGWGIHQPARHNFS